MGLLAELFVQFTTKGVSAVTSAMGTVKTGFSAVATAAAAGTASMMGFATAGLAASAEGQRLATLTGLLSREIGSLFLPAIQAGTQALQKIVTWFQSLSQAQFDSISKWAMAAVGVVAFGKALALIGATGPIGVVLSLVGGIGVLASQTEKGKAAFLELWNAGKRIFDLLGPPVMGVVTRLADILVSVLVPVIQTLAEVLNAAADGLEKLGLKAQRVGASGGGHRTLSPAGGGVESVTQTYNRIQAGALKAPGDSEKDILKEIAGHTAKAGQLTDWIKAGKKLPVELPQKQVANIAAVGA